MASYKGILGVKMITESDLLPVPLETHQTAPTDPAPPDPALPDPTPFPTATEVPPPVVETEEIVYEDWTHDELLAKAEEFGIEDRSQMDKSELIDAILNAEQG